MRFRLPKIEAPPVEQKPSGHGCEFHKHERRDQKETEPQVVEQPPSWISQLAFSHNLNYLACLVSGGLNGILIYEWQLKSKPNVVKWIDLTPSKTKKLPTPYITQVSFNPLKQDQICASGPNGTLAFFMIEQNSELIRTASVIGVADIAKKATVTGHAWEEDANYIVSCTDNGWIIISSLARAEVSQTF